MAESKLSDAILLLSHLKPSNAYYLAGYAVELGLKACIARQISHETIPDKDFSRDIYLHDLPKLVRLAGLDKDQKTK